MRVKRTLRACARALRDLQVVVHPDARDADDAVDVLDVPFDVARDAVGVIRDLASCQGP